MREWIAELKARAVAPNPVIVDGGANKGRIAAELLEAFPTARILAFEPLPALARKLRKRFAHIPSVTVIEAALGAAPGKAILRIPQSRTLSSLLAPTGIRDKYPGRDLEHLETADVTVVRMDEAVMETAGRADMIKLDLQGFELEALKGATGLLPGVRAILTETAFVSLYENQPLFPQLETFLRGYGFRFERFFEPFLNEDGETISADALFLKK